MRDTNLEPTIEKMISAATFPEAEDRLRDWVRNSGLDLISFTHIDTERLEGELPAFRFEVIHYAGPRQVKKPFVVNKVI